MRGKKGGLALVALALTLGTAALAQEVEREGVITGKSGNSFNVRTREGPVTVVVTPSTVIREREGGALGSRRERDAGSLINGLIITVEGDQQGQTITAERIVFRERDWRAAVAAQGGTIEQMAELRQAIIDGNEYVIRDEVTVYFATGSATVAEQYRAPLRQLAQNASSHGNYRISILGFADPTGNAEANERLSLRRAGAVSNFLRQTGSIQPGRVLSPSAMGETGMAPGMEAPRSNDAARRVVVRVVTPKTQLTQ